MKKPIGVLLILSTLLLLLASCGGKTPAATTGSATTAAEGATTDATTDAATEAETTADKWEEIAQKITMLAEKERSLKIECSEFVTAEKASKNDIYLKGPDAVEDGVTPAIQAMVYERNRDADELFQTTVEFVFWKDDWGQQAGHIDTVVKGNAADAPDLFVNMLYDLNLELLNGSFKDIWSIPNSFFDFDSRGWLTAWMENLSFSGDRAYILGSDYFIDAFRSMAVLPFNLTLMDENAEALAPAILEEGETLGAGEELSTYFFDLVDMGKWTWDVLGKLCEAIWVDTDGNQQDSIGDRLGIIADEYGGINSGSFIYSCGEELTEVYRIEDESSPDYNKQKIKYADTSAGLERIFDEVKAVFDGPGSLSTYAKFAGDTPDEPGVAYHHIKFAESELLFAGVCLLGGLEDETFQNMEDLYSVVPCPKTDAAKPYNSIIHNVADVGAINVHLNPRKLKTVTAYLQFCTERSTEIREEFLETVTKYKTTTYNQGTDRMLDLIYASILYGRDKTVDDLVGGQRWHSLMKEQHFVAGSDYITTQYASMVSGRQNKLNGHLKTWYTLPKVEPEAN